MAKLEPVTIEFNVDAKKFTNKIRKVKRSIAPPITPTPSFSPLTDMLVSLAGIFMIFPAIMYGAFTFFGAGFKSGLDATIRMYNELMDDAKKWAR
jgi:hypothetical protein